MSARPRAVLSAISTCLAGALLVAGCSSSGGGSASVSQSQIEAKLKKDSQVTDLLNKLPASAKAKDDAIVTCIAKALKKDASGSSLDNYVNKDGSLNDIKGKDSGSKDKATSEVESCVKDALS